MSAGTHGEYPGEPPLTIHRAVTLLAPKMQAAVTAFLAECAAEGMDAVVHETYRERSTAQAYFKRGRTQRPPLRTVTNAPDETYTWHGYQLACDVISRSKGWGAGEAWFEKMGAIAKRHGLKWGGDWTHPDRPHVQWGRCKASPSAEARRLLAEDGMHAVWVAVGAA